MGFTDQVRTALLERIGLGKRFANNKRMADELGVDPSQLNRFLKQERGLNAQSLGKILDGLDAKLVFPDDPAEGTREIRLVPPGGTLLDYTRQSPEPEDFVAVPLTSLEDACLAGGIPEDRVKGWFLVWRHHGSIRERTNLVAVHVADDDTGMSPLLHPRDMVLVDRDDRGANPPGKIMLVREPGATACIRRVSNRPLDNDTELIFYSENSRQVPPSTFRLNRDYGGDMARAIGGQVVWAWSDMTLK